jgi:hypothetical protein
MRYIFPKRIGNDHLREIDGFLRNAGIMWNHNKGLHDQAYGKYEWSNM